MRYQNTRVTQRRAKAVDMAHSVYVESKLMMFGSSGSR
jgi:hypothetical protein